MFHKIKRIYVQILYKMYINYIISIELDVHNYDNFNINELNKLLISGNLYLQICTTDKKKYHYNFIKKLLTCDFYGKHFNS